jgi:four helix bundle protein
MPANGQSAPKDYKDLLEWQNGMALSKLVYRLTVRFPRDEKFGLALQIRRAAVSVPANIAEGQARQNAKEFLQFLSHAEGSLAELETQALLSVELGFVYREDLTDILSKIDELQKMIVGLKRKLSSLSPLAIRHSPLSRAERH